MAIEGRLGDLGIHGVFQLLDVSRKTGRLHVASSDRGNAGTVLFEGGQVVGARIQSNPHRLGDLLVRSGRLDPVDLMRAEAAQAQGDPRRLGEILVALGLVTPTEIARQMRLQAEAVVFELLSWPDGWFRFEEALGDDRPEAALPLAVESLLMEGARRIDEWSRIADAVPSSAMVPALAGSAGESTARLELLPSEWHVLALVDGETDLRGIAAAAGMSDFDAARIVYGLLRTGVVTLSAPVAAPVDPARDAPTERDRVVTCLAEARDAVAQGALAEGIAAWEAAQAAGPDAIQAATIAEGLAAARRLLALVRAGVEGAA